jgi:hypothetical protein
MSERIYNVLFLCTGNSARSILAESILRKDGRRHFRAFSAGSQPKGTVNPFAIKVLRSLDYPTDDLRSKSWEEFARADAPGWISSSRFATTRRANPVRYGRTADDGALGKTAALRDDIEKRRPLSGPSAISRIASPPSPACHWKALTNCRSEPDCAISAAVTVRPQARRRLADVRI